MDMNDQWNPFNDGFESNKEMDILYSSACYETYPVDTISCTNNMMVGSGQGIYNLIATGLHDPITRYARAVQKNAVPFLDHFASYTDQGSDDISSITNQKIGSAKTLEKPNSVKGHWSPDEDGKLMKLVEQHGLKKWSRIAREFSGRIGKQCRERWNNHLRPNIKKDTWSEEEDVILIEAHKEVGNKWAEISKRLDGRTENSVKNHWNATRRRQFARKRRNSSKNLKSGSLLQNYIESLGYPSNRNTHTPLQAPTNSKTHEEGLMRVTSPLNNNTMQMPEEKCEDLELGNMADLIVNHDQRYDDDDMNYINYDQVMMYYCTRPMKVEHVEFDFDMFNWDEEARN